MNTPEMKKSRKNRDWQRFSVPVPAFSDAVVFNAVPFKNRSRTISIFLLVALFALIHASTAFAHKVSVFAYVDEGKVHTESYFANGGACMNSEITVFDGEGHKLLGGTTDDKGLFSFVAPGQMELKIVLNAGMGHRAEYILSKSETSLVSDGNAPEEPIDDIKETKSVEASTEASQRGLPDVSCVSEEQLRKIVEEATTRQMKPILNMVRRNLRQGASPGEIAGGIGYIIGLAGLWAFFLSKRKK